MNFMNSNWCNITEVIFQNNETFIINPSNCTNVNGFSENIILYLHS